MNSLGRPLLSKGDEPPLAEPGAATSCWSRLCSGLSFSWISSSLGGGQSLSLALRLEGGLADADARFQAQRRARPDRSLLMCLVAVFWPGLARAAAYKLAADVLRYMPPLLLARLLARLHSCGDLEAYALALGLPLATLAQALLVNQYFWYCLRTGVQVCQLADLPPSAADHRPPLLVTARRW